MPACTVRKGDSAESSTSPLCGVMFTVGCVSVPALRLAEGEDEDEDGEDEEGDEEEGGGEVDEEGDEEEEGRVRVAD